MNRRSTQLLIAATALAAPALLSACGTETTDARLASGTPSSSAPAASSGVTAGDLLTDADTVYVPGAADWFTVETFAGDAEAVFNPCAAGSLAETGATSVQGREFELRNLQKGAPEVHGDFLVQMVAEYDDEAAATKAWSTVNGWLEECEARPADLTEYRALQTRKVAVPGADAVITDSHYGPLPEELDDGHSTHIMETGVARVGNRLTVITSVVVAQDYNFLEEDGGTPVEQMLPLAAERLQD